MVPLVLIVIPFGGLRSRYEILLAGISLSVAVLITVSVVRAEMVRSVCAGRIGALFTSLTVTVKLLVALKGGVPLSVTTVLTVLVLGPCASVGVHVITPAVLMAAPGGALTSR